jgi:CheY-like chemotaxis protein
MRKILVVDDDASVRALVRDVLEVEGYDVTWPEDGFAGLRRIESDRPDCVVLDIMMPGHGRATPCCSASAPATAGRRCRWSC